jgi:hypothetical protein
MNNGTLDFYSAVAEIIPVIVLAYIFSFRFVNTLKQFYDEIFNGGDVLLIDHSGFGTLAIFLAPFVGIGMAVVGEAACLRALFTGHPTPADARWTIDSLLAMSVAITAQIAAIGLTQLYRNVRQGFDESKKKADNTAGKWRGRHATSSRKHSGTDSETAAPD